MEEEAHIRLKFVYKIQRVKKEMDKHKITESMVDDGHGSSLAAGLAPKNHADNFTIKYPLLKL